MLKLLKWAYDLGVKQERQRIAGALRAEADKRTVEVVTYNDVYADKGNGMSKARKDKVLYRSAVSTEVGNIIKSILHPKEEWIQSSSIMFPDEEKI